MQQEPRAVWAAGAAYEPYIGRWSRAAPRERIRAGLPLAAGGSISLVARAWTVQGAVPEAAGKGP